MARAKLHIPMVIIMKVIGLRDTWVCTPLTIAVHMCSLEGHGVLVSSDATYEGEFQRSKLHGRVGCRLSSALN